MNPITKTTGIGQSGFAGFMKTATLGMLVFGVFGLVLWRDLGAAHFLFMSGFAFGSAVFISLFTLTLTKFLQTDVENAPGGER